MNKATLIQKMAERTGYTQKHCQHDLEVLIEIIAEELKQGHSLMIQGFGSFSPWAQTERVGRNPRTGVSCTIRPRNSVKFKPGKTLLQRLNGLSAKRTCLPQEK